MDLHPLAGKPAPVSLLVNVPRLISAYYTLHPDMENPDQAVEFGTNGHRGSSFNSSFNEDHILAIVQALCLYRRSQGIDGPLFLGMDTHGLSEPAQISALEVLAANGVTVMIAEGYTPTPVISHAIITHNRGRSDGMADGIVITSSHNPPDNGGIKYNPPQGGPADTGITDWIAVTANALLREKNRGVQRIPYARALKVDTTHPRDYIKPYVDDLQNIVNMEAVKASGLKIGADALGGAGLAYWPIIAETYGLDIDIMHARADAAFSFMTVDGDGKIRMDCSSPYAMAGLIGMKDNYDIAFGNDPDFDRHGIVTPTGGLMSPNHFLAVAINYLFRNRQGWRRDATVGKTLVSSSMIDRVAADLKRPLAEMPVGFKWFVDGLLDGSCGFGGEESAGASFLRRDGTVWTTDKDGFIMDLLAAEITAVTGHNPAQHYAALVRRFGDPLYERLDIAADASRRNLLKKLSPEQIATDDLAGEKIVALLTRAPGNNAPIGGLKVVTPNGWFAARPSGTEDIYKVYAESFKGAEHLTRIQSEAQAIISAVFAGAGL